MDSPTISQNFSVAKVVAIFVVVTSHWFTELPLWILSTVALFIFGFASSFFTGRIYGAKVNVGAFWTKKLQRLGIRYWFILAVISLLLLFQGKEIFHWHSLVHFAGMSGILNLFGPSVSELGRALWFFTLLLLFYFSYPLVAKYFVSSTKTNIFLFLITVSLLVLNEQIHLVVSLWLTLLGFILGIYVGVNRLQVSSFVLKCAMAGFVLAFIGINVVFAYRGLNGVLLFAISITTSLWLTVAKFSLPRIVGALADLEKCLLEIYLIHMYLFFHPTGKSALDFLISFVLIIVSAYVLNAVGTRLVASVFRADARQVPARG